jgi:biopolymer transport protein ExbD
MAVFKVSNAKGARVMLKKAVVSLVVLVLVTGIATAATLEGTIKKVDADKSTVVVTDKDKKDTTVTLNKDAKITLDGKEAKIADLAAGQTVTVTHDDTKASKVEAKTK